MGFLHVLVVLGCKHKSCSAVVLPASQLWRTVSFAEVILKTLFACKLLITAVLLAFERLFFEVHRFDVSGQYARGGTGNSAVGIIARYLLLSMSC